ncbi:hypothetical protein IWQ60_000995 [Tieghemiomyces parasiticus]|uniref:Kinesin motor domain-containing protein n=1 Tax=Tieghemiomyces parasiticus TaxID=78921 RepID=A0A9W8E287_9FUNG|nr:hypothetical protein IWQ60_000995 [Tieghemiomyces parasiticus]
MEPKDAAALPGADHINVTVRLRPLNARELRAPGTQNAWSVQNDTLTQLHTHAPGRTSLGNSFTFDHVFDPDRTTREVFDGVAQDIIHCAMDGFNGTIFAYGQTSSGKTHTMYGIPEEPGIIDLSLRRIFERIEQTPDREYLLRVSFLEIYNEVITDLLNPHKTHLRIHEHPTRGIFVGDLTENIVMSVHDVRQLLAQGDRNRHVGETNMNDRSSRSHTIFRMVIESRERSVEDCHGDTADAQGSPATYTGAVKVSCLNLVDLAGSERVAHTGAEGVRLREGAHINRSLLTLGTVIAKLTDTEVDRATLHIPYRDSKLTRILEPSLGGNAKTAIVCTITPASTHVEETLSTLKFASRAKHVCNKPEINEELTGEALLRVYHKEISELKKKLDEYRAMNGPREIEKLTHQKLQIEEYNEVIRRQLREKEDEENRLRKHYEELKMMIIDSSRLRSPEPAAAAAGRKIRRQTWFPGTKGNLVEYQVAVATATEAAVAPIHGSNGSGPSTPTAHGLNAPRSATGGPPKRRASEMDPSDDEAPGNSHDGDGAHTVPLPPLSQHPNTFATIVEQQKALTALQAEVLQARSRGNDDRAALATLEREKARLLEGIRTLVNGTESTGTDPTANRVDLPNELQALYEFVRNYRAALAFTKNTLKRTVKRQREDQDFSERELVALQTAHATLQTRYNTECGQLTAKLTALTVKYSELEGRGHMEVDLLSQQLEDYKARLKAAKRAGVELDQVRATLATHEERAAELQAALAAAQATTTENDATHAAQRKEYEAELALLRTTVDEGHARIATLEAERVDRNRRLADHAAATGPLRTALHALQADYAALEAFAQEIIRESRVAVAALGAELSASRADQVAVEAARLQIQGELDAALVRIAELTTAMRTREETQASQAAELDRLREAVQAATQALVGTQDAHTAALDQLRGELAVARTTAAHDVDRLTSELETMTARFQEELAAMTATVTEQQTALDRAQADRTAQSTAVATEELTTLKSRLETTLAEFAAFRTGAAEEACDKTTMIHELREALTADRRTLHEQRQREETLTSQLDQMATTMVQCEAELTQRLEAVLSCSTTLESELQQLRDDYDTLTTSHRELQEQECQTAEILEAWREETESTEVDLRNTLADREATVLDLAAQLAQAKEAETGLREQCNTLTERLTATAMEVDTARTETQEAREAHIQLQAERKTTLAGLQAELGALESVVRESTEAMIRLQTERDTDRADRDRAMLACQDQAVICANHTAALARVEATLTDERSAAERRTAELNAQLATLRDELATQTATLRSPEDTAHEQARLEALTAQLAAQTMELDETRTLTSRLEAIKAELEAKVAAHEQQQIELVTLSSARIDELIIKGEALQTELLAAYTAAEEHRVQVNQLTSELAEAHRERDAARSELQQLRDDAVQGQVALDESRTHLQAALRDAESHLAAERERYTAVVAQHASVESLATERALELEQLQGELLAARTAHASAIVEIETVRGELTTFRAEEARSRSEAEIEMTARLEALQAQTNEQDAALAELQAERDASQCRITEGEARLTDLTTQLAANEDIRNQLEAKLAELQATFDGQIEAQTTTIAELQARLIDHEAAVADHAARSAEYEAQANDLRLQMTTMGAQHAEALATVEQQAAETRLALEAQLTSYIGTAESHNAEVAQLRATAERLEAERDALHRSVADGETAIKALKVSKVEVRTQLFELTEKIRTAKSERKELTKQVAELKSEEAIRKQQIDHQKAELEKWKLAYRHEQKKTRKLAAEYEARFRELQSTVQGKQQQLMDLQQLLQQREGEAEQANRKLAQAEQEAAAAGSNSHATHGMSGGRGDTLAAELDANNDTLDHRQALTLTFQQEIATLQRENQRLKQEYRTLMLAKNNEITKTRQLTSSIHELQTDNDRLRKEVERLGAQLATAQKVGGSGLHGVPTKTPLRPSTQLNGQQASLADGGVPFDVKLMAAAAAGPPPSTIKRVSTRSRVGAGIDENGLAKVNASAAGNPVGANVPRSVRPRRSRVAPIGGSVTPAPVDNDECKQQ